MSWLSKIYTKANKVYSQTYQDGIIKEIFNNIGVINKFCIEFGFNDKDLIGGSGSNVARLVLEDKWTALLFDGDNENLAINLHKEFLTPENVSEIFTKNKVPKVFDYLSIDVDSTDLWLLKAILKSGYRPSLFSVEYNANFHIDMSVTVLPGTVWKGGDAVYGASLLALNKVAEEFDYCLVAAIEKYDLFFIKKDLISPLSVPLSDFKRFVGLPTHISFGKPTKERLKNLVSYPSMDSIPQDYLNRLEWY